MPKRAFRGLRDTGIYVLLALLALLLSVLYHANLRLGREASAHALTGWVSGQMQGSLRLGEIKTIGLDGIELEGAELLDPEGRRVIYGEEVRLQLDYMALLRGVLRFSHAHLHGGEFVLIDNGEGTPTFLDAFEPTEPTPPDEPPDPDPFHAIVDDLRLEGVTIHGEVLGLEGLRIEGARATGRMEFHHTTEIRIRSLTGDLVAPFPRPARLESVSAAIFGDERGAEVDARVSMGEEHATATLRFAPPPNDPSADAELDLRVRPDPIRGETLSELGFEWASVLRGETHGEVRLHGPTDALALEGALTTAGGAVALQGALPSEGDVELAITTDSLGLAEVLADAPALQVAGEVTIASRTGAPEGETELVATLRPFEFEGFEIPESVSRATLLPNGDVRVDSVEAPIGGGRTTLTGTVSSAGRLDLRIRGFIPQVANEPNVAERVPGLRASARYDLRLSSRGATPERYDIRGDVSLGTMAYGSVRAPGLDVQGRVFGDLAAPSVDLNTQPRGLVVAGVPLGTGRIRLVGDADAYVAEGELRDPGSGRTTTFQGEARQVRDGTAVEIPTLSVRTAGARLRGSVSGVQLRRDGSIALGVTQLIVGGAPSAGERENPESEGASEARAVDDGRLTIRGHYAPRRDDTIDIALRGVPSAQLLELVGVRLDGEGDLDVDVELRGDLDETPRLYAYGEVSDGRWLSVDPIAVQHFWATYEPGDLAAAAEIDIGDRGALVVKLTSVPNEDEEDLLDALRGGSFRLDVTPRDLDLALVGDFFPDEELPAIEGNVRGYLAVEGTLDAPRILVRAHVPELGIGVYDELDFHLGGRYDDSNLLAGRVSLADPRGPLLEAEAQIMVPIGAIFTGEVSAADAAAFAPWQIALSVPPRTPRSLPDALRAQVPALLEDLRVALSATLKGGGGWPLRGDAFASLDYQGEMSDALCASNSRPRGNVVASLRGRRLDAEVDGMLGDRSVLRGAAEAEVDVMEALSAVLNGEEVRWPEVRLAGQLQSAPMESLPAVCRYVAGPLTGEFEAALFGDAPMARLVLDADGLRARAMTEGIQGSGHYVRSTPPADVELTLELTPDEARVAFLGEWWNDGETALTASAPIHWEDSPALPVADLDTELEGTARFDRTPLRGLLVWLNDVAGIEGVLDGEVNVDGTVGAPTANGELVLTEGRVDLRTIGQRLRNVSGTFRFDGDQLAIREMRATDGNGDIEINADVGIEGLAPRQVHSLRVEAENFPVREEGSIMAELNGQAELDGCFCSADSSCELDGETRSCDIDSFYGRVRVDRLDVGLPDESSRSTLALTGHPDVHVVGEADGERSDGPVDQVWYLRVDASQRFWVRSASQDFAAQVSAQLDLSLAGDVFKIRGEARLHRGNFSVFGKVFEVESGSMLFRNETEIDPVVSLVAAHSLRSQSGDVVRVEVSGTLSRPEVRFSTTVDGVADQGEIIALLLTGDTRIDRSLQSPDSNPQGAAAEATDFLAGVAFGIATLALREQFGELIPTIRIEMGDGGFRTPIIRAGINVDSLIPERLRRVVRGIYIEGYFTARRADGTEDSTRQAHDNGFLIELQFPSNIVGTSDYSPPSNWSLDITWEP